MTASQPQLQQFLSRALYDLAAAQSALLVIIGSRLGLYRAMSNAGGLTSEELAARTATSERYVREWLINQVAGGYVELRDDGRFVLPEVHAAILASDDPSVNVIAAYEAMLALHPSLDEVIHAFRGGEGVTGSSYSPKFHQALGDFSSTIYRRRLDGWISAAGLAGELRKGIRVADVACGNGAAALILARQYPASQFVGIDVNPSLIEQARQNAGGLSNVRFEVGDAAALGGTFDLVTCCNALHDMPDPGAFVRAVGANIKRNGAWLVCEPRLADSVRDVIDPLGRYSASLSLLYCIPVARSLGGDGIGSVLGKGRIFDALRGGGFQVVQEIEDTYCLVMCARRGPSSQTSSN